MKEKTKDIIEFLKRKYKWIILFLGLILFIETLNNVFANEIMRRDVLGYEFISKYLINDTITPIAKFITWFGGVTGLIVIGIILTIVLRNKVIGFCI